MDNNINLYKVIIASYLHDIWKLFVRAWYSRVTKKYWVSHAEHLKNILENWSEYIKLNLWDNNNLESKLDKIKKSSFWKDIWILWSLHHWVDFSKYWKIDEAGKEYKREFRQMIFCIYMADNIWSFDRLSNDNEGEKLDNSNFRKQWLTTIYENIFNLSDKKEFTNSFSYSADILGEESIDNLIPNNDDTNFKWLANKFLIDLIELIHSNLDFTDIGKLKIFISKLDILAQKYFTFVPSDVYQWKIFDISLYDHTKLVVSNSVVLYKKFFDSQSLGNLHYDTNIIKWEEITLIAWDFPSIQNYIFDWIKKQTKIAKRLRAKSLRVQLLNEAIIEYILDLLNLPRANVILNAWWKFVILSDKLWGNFEKINIKEKINEFLLNNFNWNIWFSIISKDYKIWELFEVNNSDNEKINIQDVFVNLFEKLSQDKFKVYSKDNLKDIFNHENIWWKVLCKYCWQNYVEKINDDENSDENICLNCKQEVVLWEKVVKNPYWVRLIYKNWNKFDYSESMLDKENFEEELKKEDKNSIFVIFNKWEYLFAEKNCIISKSINIYVPKLKNNSVKDFDDIIIDDKDKKEWLDYICMLKWDIDSMSLVFKHWFNYWDINNTQRNSFYSVNRLTQFSRFLELFFWMYLNKKIEDKFENVYTVFSWWDDFIFIVPFSKREEFTQFLYNEFNKFTWENKRLHFSIWLWIFKNKTPFKIMDSYTEELLKKAKYKSKQKNIDSLDNINSLLSYKWLTIYEEDYTKIFDNTSINYRAEINNWLKEDDKIIIWDTQTYKLYSELKRFRDILSQRGGCGDIVLIWARILNMLSRNSKEIKKENEFQNLRKNIILLIQKFELWDNIEKIEKINAVLLWLIDNIYKTRYFNK